MHRQSIIVLVCLLFGLTLAMTGLDIGRGTAAVTHAAVTTITSCLPSPSNPNIGCKDAAFPANPGKSDFSPTGEKPQSKLWFNDGRWWASMLDSTSKSYYIYYLQDQTWIKTTTQLDTRLATQADCLWDAASNKLYVASGAGAVPTGYDLDAKLYRYSYAAGTYTLDAGFPVTIRSGGAETIVIDKDTTGRLWITYTQHDKVWINHSTTADNFWAQPFNPPLPANSNVATDDISSLVAFGGKVGVLWSNQTDSTFYFAVHKDTDNPGTSWQSGIVLRQSNVADDHMNLKSVQADGGGNVFAVVKTSIDNGGANDPRILVLRRDPAGNWSSAVFVHEIEGTTPATHTRAILLIDSANHRLYVFATSSDSGGTIIYKESSDYTAGALSFPAGWGTDFIKIGGLGGMNNSTSTKQNVDGNSGIVVLASDGTYRYYAHNVILLTNPPATPTPTRAPNTPTPTPQPTPTTPSATAIPPQRYTYLPLVMR